MKELCSDFKGGSYFERILPYLTEVFEEIFYAANPALYESLKIIFAVFWGNFRKFRKIELTGSSMVNIRNTDRANN